MKIDSKVDGSGGAGQQEVLCKKCGARWNLVERLLIGEVIECRHCDQVLEVSGLSPIELVPFRRIEESEEELMGFDLL